MPKRNAKHYLPAPTIAPALRPRAEAVLSALSGATTVSEAARALSLSRNRFQTVMHRGLEALVAAIRPGTPGRPRRAPRERELEEENAKLRRENELLKARLKVNERLLETKAGLFRERVTSAAGRAPKNRARRNRATARPETPKVGEDDEPRIAALSLARTTPRSILPRRLLSCAIGVDPSTFRRWRRRGTPPQRTTRARRERLPNVSPEVVAAVAARVRATHGLIGAESLRRTFPGVSRRQASALKRGEIARIERDRLASTSRVEITSPGVVRGFDAVFLRVEQSRWYLLGIGDASVPYRTSAPISKTYDEHAVRRALENDFREAGIPLVLRMDRASAHRTPAVRAMLAALGVLVLHGPPHLPRFYGQLERQNREHRAWFAEDRALRVTDLESERDAMLYAVNELWRRPSLAWKTAHEVWSARPALVVDRAELCARVAERVARWAAERRSRRADIDTAQRFAIERTLGEMGYLRIHLPGRCQEIRGSGIAH